MSLMALYQVIEDEKLINKAILLKDTTTLKTLGCRMRSNIPIVESDDFDAMGTIANVRVDVTYSAIGDGNYRCNGGDVYNLDTMPIKTLYRDTNGVNQLVTAIKEGAFKVKTFNKIIFPQKLTTIGARAFEGCTNLTSITLPKGMVLIDSWAFSGCKKLEEVIYEGTSEEFVAAARKYQNPFAGTKVTIIKCPNDEDILWQ